MVRMTNDTDSARTIHVNTRPSVGENGCRVQITMSNGTIVATKDFPYYTTTSDLTAAIGSGEMRRVYLQPVKSGQAVSGTLECSIQ